MAATTTTIKGVQILTKKRARRADVFDITLSIEGIDVARPGRTVQHMGWDRVSQWEIEERSGYVLLTLRGDGAVTPLVVRGWTLDELEAVMRDITEGSPRTVSTSPAAPVPPTRRADRAETAEPAMPVAPTELTEPAAPAETTAHEAPAAPAEPERDAQPESPEWPDSTAPRAERRQQRRAKRSGLPWKAVVTVVLLCVLGAAVTLVLLQSAGIISWGILGPIA